MLRLWQWLKDRISICIGNTNWKTKDVLTTAEFEDIKNKLKDDYYIILTRHDGHLSSYAISFAHWVLTRGKSGYYGHVLMNLEDTVKDDSDYRFIEATGVGVHYSGFYEAFDEQTSSVALLKPKSMTLDKWTAVMDKAKTALGRPYDTLFDLSKDNALSCVELVRFALQAEPDYASNFVNFEKMIANYKNLDPHMFYECDDFEIVWETRH